jgi:hypothetical protein
MAGHIPSYERRNIITGMASLFLMPYDATIPAELPPNTEPLGFDWAEPWEPVGATLEGVTVTFAREATDIRIEEQTTPVDQKTTSAGFTLSLSLAEDTLNTMRYAYGGGIIETIAPTATEPGVMRLRISEEVEHFALGLEGQAPARTGIATPWRRILIPDVTSVAEVETGYRRAEQQRVYPATFTSLVPVSEIDILELNALMTGP